MALQPNSCLDLHLTTHNIHNRHTSMPPAGFEPTIPKNERLKSYVLYGTANWIGVFKWLLLLIIIVVMSDPDAKKEFSSCVPDNYSIKKVS